MGRIGSASIRTAACAAAWAVASAWAGADAPEGAPSDERRVEGRVLDPSGAVIPGAAVSLRQTVTGFERLMRSDAQGRFGFDRLGAARHTLSASAGGFERSTRSIEPSDAGPFDVTLRPAPVVEEVTVVSASRSEELRQALDTKVDVVSRERIRDTGYESVGEVLRELPGVLTRRGSEAAGAAGEQIQGIDSRQVLVLLDGQPLLGARGIKRGTLNLDRQSVGRLERVEVVKGAASALYGSDAIGGVVNLVTREPERPLEGGLTVSGGNRGVLDARGEGGFARGRFSGFALVQRHASDGFDLTPATPDTTGADEARNDVFAKLRFSPGPALSLTGLVNGYWNTAIGRVVGEEGLQTNDVGEDSQNYGLTADWQAGGGTALQARAYFSRFDELTDGRLLATDAALPRGELQERLAKGDVSVSRVVGGRQLVQAGAELWWNEYGGVNRLRDEQDGETVTTRVLWAQDRIQLAAPLTLTLGGRLDDHSSFGSAFSPKVGLNARLAGNLRLRASYGRGFRAPDLGQLYYRFLNPTSIYQVIGNPDLKPEHAHSFQLGGELSLRRGRARLGVNLFRNDVQDLIESVNLGFVASPAQLQDLMAREGIDGSFRPVFGRLLFRYQNVADARTQGVELDGEAALGAGFSIGGAYTYLDGRDDVTGLRLTNRNRHMGSARLGYESARLGVRANLRGSFFSSWIASRSTTASGVSEVVAPSFSLLDAYAAKRIADGLEAFVAVDNLTDDQDPNIGRTGPTGQPLPIYRAEVGRTYRVGLRVALAKPAGSGSGR